MFGKILSLAGGLSGWKLALAGFAVGCAVTGYGAWKIAGWQEAERQAEAYRAETLRLVAVNAATEAAHAAEVANLEANLAALNRVAQKEAEERQRLEGVVEALAAIDPAEDCVGGEAFDPIIDMLWPEEGEGP